MLRYRGHGNGRPEERRWLLGSWHHISDIFRLTQGILRGTIAIGGVVMVGLSVVVAIGIVIVGICIGICSMPINDAKLLLLRRRRQRRWRWLVRMHRIGIRLRVGQIWGGHDRCRRICNRRRVGRSTRGNKIRRHVVRRHRIGGGKI